MLKEKGYILKHIDRENISIFLIVRYFLLKRKILDKSNLVLFVR